MLQGINPFKIKSYSPVYSKTDGIFSFSPGQEGSIASKIDISSFEREAMSALRSVSLTSKTGISSPYDLLFCFCFCPVIPAFLSKRIPTTFFV